MTVRLKQCFLWVLNVVYHLLLGPSSSVGKVAFLLVPLSPSTLLYHFDREFSHASSSKNLNAVVIFSWFFGFVLYFFFCQKIRNQWTLDRNGKVLCWAIEHFIVLLSPIWPMFQLGPCQCFSLPPFKNPSSCHTKLICRKIWQMLSPTLPNSFNCCLCELRIFSHKTTTLWMFGATFVPGVPTGHGRVLIPDSKSDFGLH